jgi:carbon storage regulator
MPGGSAPTFLHNRPMLILTRRPGERVVIGEEILVTVMGVSGHTVRLGIEAPRGVSIYREEIWLAVKEENRAAAEAKPEELTGAGGGEQDAGGREAGGSADGGTRPGGPEGDA